MSEQDNLQEADGKKELEISTENIEDSTTPKQEITEEIEDTENDDKVISEIEESNAEDAEDEGSIDRHSITKKDYEKMSMEELAEELEHLVNNQKVQAIKTHVEEIRSEFKSKFSTLLDEKKEEFLNEGGSEIDFFYSSPIQKRYKDSIKDYRTKLNAHYKSLEKSLKDNLAERLDIIEEIKGLINVEENINTTYKHFKDLQERWRKAGPIPRDKYNNAWNSYHHHVEIFYDFLHLNRDLRDLDFKHNLEQKVKIIVRAEELAQDDDLNRAFRELQVLHKMWKEELGPVDKEYREEIWKRFKAATKKIHDKRQVYFEQLDEEYEKNLELKHVLIGKIKDLGEKGAKTHNEWQKKIKEIEVLRNEFFSAGKVPIKVNEATWASFKTAVRYFNKKKNDYYKDLKKDQYDNLNKKLELIKIAEANKDSDDFDATTALMKKIQNDWKNIGHVPRKNSDKIWNQFKAACNHYFDKLHEAKNEENKEEIEAYNSKVTLLDEIKAIEFSGEKATDLKTIKDYIEQWKTIGTVPNNKRHIEGKLNKVLDTCFKSLKLNKTEAELIKFENKLEVLSNSDDSRHLDNERSFISKKIQEVKSEINQLENNLQFFTNVDESNPFVKEVLNNIQKHKDTLALWETKLNKIKAFY
ncbi:DUF349 domain-containing protein [Bizionia arctica]|uniref:DUF349 domain-containing protein n=1 Tax=Bizionia arctica TaxID=1495645 RepID=A0A917GUC1_9FLAO|nr:DUF349 domain-containing protein [Bizionia arctica]GGG57590.1 hypothetical protein GCM10010976_30550 [Bizionia arctica]